MLQDIIEYFSTHWIEYLQMLGEHVGISLASIFVAAAIAVPLGVACSKRVPLEKVSVGIASMLRVVPSLAILVICVPFLGTGALPAMVALTVLAIPPILINTTLAFRSVSADVLEAARGMGMSDRAMFFKVKVPLTFPLSFAGVRTAASEVVASATLAAYIGAGGLGEIIFTGIGLMRPDLLAIGGVSVAVLSIVVGMCLSAVDRRMHPYDFA